MSPPLKFPERIKVETKRSEVIVLGPNYFWLFMALAALFTIEAAIYVVFGGTMGVN